MEVKKFTYEIPTSADPKDFGPATWGALHDIVNNIPCGECSAVASSFMVFFHDMVNYKLGKPLHDRKNFIDWINRISKMKNQPIILK